MTKPTEIPPMMVGPRLKQCFETGGVVGLFPVLATWAQDELSALEAEIAAWLESADATLNAIHRHEALKAENFFSPAAAKALDQQIDRQRIEVSNTASEIYSVLYCYLEDATVTADDGTKARRA